MVFKVSSCYGYNYLTNGSRDERGVLREFEINGQLCSVGGVVGRLWSVKDSASHCGGHGVGNVYGSNAVLATPDMKLIVVSSEDEVVVLE